MPCCSNDACRPPPPAMLALRPQPGTRGGWGIPLRARTEGLAVPILGGTLATQPIKPTSSVAGGRQTGPDDRRDPLGAIPGSHIPPVWLLPPALSCHSVSRICRAGCTRLTGGIGHPTHPILAIALVFPPGHPSRAPPLGGCSIRRVSSGLNPAVGAGLVSPPSDCIRRSVLPLCRLRPDVSGPPPLTPWVSAVVRQTPLGERNRGEGFFPFFFPSSRSLVFLCRNLYQGGA